MEKLSTPTSPQRKCVCKLFFVSKKVLGLCINSTKIFCVRSEISLSTAKIKNSHPSKELQFSQNPSKHFFRNFRILLTRIQCAFWNVFEKISKHAFCENSKSIEKQLILGVFWQKTEFWSLHVSNFSKKCFILLFTSVTRSFENFGKFLSREISQSCRENCEHKNRFFAKKLTWSVSKFNTKNSIPIFYGSGFTWNIFCGFPHKTQSSPKSVFELKN